MKQRYFCTYFDHNYLPRAMVMLESLYAHNPHAHIYVLCLSEQCYDVMQKLAYPYVTLIQLKDFEAANPELVAVRPTRSLVEYYFTITPCLPWHLLHSIEGTDAITYLDADMMFFSSVEPIFTEAQNASVIITPHRFAVHLQKCIHWGKYNVSWMTFKNTPQGLACLAWYKLECLNWCHDVYEKKDGIERFADQKYLESFQKLFEGVHSIKHLGAGLAPWNTSNYILSCHEKNVYVDTQALIFYHAQSFRHLFWNFFASGLDNYSHSLNADLRQHIFSPYIKTFKKSCLRLKEYNYFPSTSIRFNEKNNYYALAKRTLREALHKTLLMDIA